MSDGTAAAYPKWAGFDRERDFALMGIEDPSKSDWVPVINGNDMRDNRDPQMIGTRIKHLMAENSLTVRQAANMVAGPSDPAFDYQNQHRAEQ